MARLVLVLTCRLVVFRSAPRFPGGQPSARGTNSVRQRTEMTQSGCSHKLLTRASVSSVTIAMLSERGMDHGHGADTCKAGQGVMLPSTRRKSTHAVTESASAAFQIGQDPAMFEARPAIDLSNPRLRTLPAALDP